MRFGFCGGSYQSQTPLVDAELSINFYAELAESQGARTQYSLLPTPGLALYCNLPAGNGANGGVRGSLPVSGRTFKVAGTHLYEILNGGAVVDYGGFGGNNNMVNDGLPATMVAGGTASGKYPGQLLIASGGTLTAFNLATNVFVAITSAPAQVLMVAYLDGFFVALQATNDFQVSAVLDCTNWPGLSISQVSVYTDQLQAIITTNRLLWVFGAARAVSYYTSGLPQFPFSVNSTGFLEVGIQAQYSVARVALAASTTIMWMGADDRGANVVFAANGYVPTRVSNHAFEYWMSQRTTADAVGFATQELGHNFYWLWFPTANATWRLDADLGQWHQMASIVGGRPNQAHLARCHQYNFGQHLVGDRNSGNVYAMGQQFYSEMTGVGIATPIIRTRIGPTVSAESSQNPIPINEFQVDFETGLGPQPPFQLLNAQGRPRAPLATLNYSEDFGKTWGPDRILPCGQAGKFLTEAIDRRLGVWRSFTPKLTVSDPIPWRIADAYINPTQDSSPRYAKQILKVS